MFVKNDLDIKNYKPKPWTITKEELEKEYIKPIKKWSTKAMHWHDGITPLEANDIKEHQNVGDWCKWCKAQGICNAYKAQHEKGIIELFQTGLEQLGKKGVEDPKVLKETGIIPLDLVVYITLNKSTIVNFINAVAKIPLSLLEQGDDVPGVKAIPVMSNRSYIDNEAEVVQFLQDHGVEEPVRVEKKLISMTEAEKIVGKKEMAEIIKDGQPVGFKVVKEDHKTPAHDFKQATKSLFSSIVERLNEEEGK